MQKLTVAQGTALSAGAVLGTGIISMPALAAAVAGPASLIAWLALVLLSAPLAWTFAELGARFPDGGGVSSYVRRAFGTCKQFQPQLKQYGDQLVACFAVDQDENGTTQTVA